MRGTLPATQQPEEHCVGTVSMRPQLDEVAQRRIDRKSVV
jgi:hypothetical protein